MILMVISWCILSHKDRGWGYYLLSFFLPPIGFIVALCLKNKKKTIDETQIEPSSIDISLENTVE